MVFAGRYRITIKPEFRYYYLEPIGDLHIGHIGFDEKKFLERREVIMNEPNRYTVFMGDMIDGIVSTAYYSDTRMDIRERDRRFVSVEDQLSFAEELLRPIAKKSLGLIEGNHEQKVSKLSSVDVGRRLAKGLNIKFLGSAALISLQFVDGKGNVRWEVPIFITHGTYGGKRVGGAVNALEDVSRFIRADVYLQGHTHKLWAYKSMVYEIKNGHLITKYPIFANTGSFLKAYQLNKRSYVEEKLLPPSKTGTITIIFDIKDKRVHYVE